MTLGREEVNASLGTSTGARWGEDGAALARDTARMAVAQFLRAIIQAAYFVIIARALGATGYGAFVAATALVAVLSPFSTLGAGPVLIKNVSRDASVFSIQWGRCLILAIPSALVLFAVACVLSRFVLPSVSWVVVVFVALSDLLLARVAEIAGQAYQAFDRLARTAQILVVGSLVRLIGALALVLVLRSSDVDTWAALYFAATATVCFGSVAVVNRELGLPSIRKSSIRTDVAEGIYFSVGVSAQTVYNDIDKTMIASIVSLEAAGIYAAAYRIIDTALTPIRSVLFSAYAHFFRHGTSGLVATVRYAKRLLWPTVAYSLICGLLLYACAPLVPRILGSGYEDTGRALRFLAALPLLKSLQYFAADALTGAGRQKTRSIAQAFVAIFNILLNLWLISQYSWIGAVWASLVSDALLVLLLWSAIRWSLHCDSAGYRGKALAAHA